MPRLWTLWIPDAAVLASRAAGVLSAGETRRAQAFHRDHDRHRYVVAHVWLRRILGDVLDVPAGSVAIEPGPCAHCGGPHGKPRLAARTDLHFSLSHSGDVALCAVADRPVGVDVEAVPPGTGYAELAGCLAPEERAALDALSLEHRAKAFTQCWVRKEAYLKGTGEGLSREPQAVSVGLGPRFAGAADALAGWQLIDLEAPSGYAAALATMPCATRSPAWAT